MGDKNFIAGIGCTNVDILYSGIDRLPNEGEEIYAKHFSLQLGGGVPATLINLGRLGIKTKIATELGDDIFSNYARQEFEKCGVSPINLFKGNDDIPLNVTSAMITSRDRTFMSYGHGSVEATPDALDAAYKMCTGAKIVIMHTGGFLPVYKKLKSEGTMLVFDCGWDDNLSLENYKEHLELADYYTPNQKEALKITDTDTPEKAADVLSNYLSLSLIKTAASEWKTERNFMSVKLTISSTLTQQVQATHSLQASFTAYTTKKALRIQSNSAILQAENALPALVA